MGNYYMDRSSNDQDRGEHPPRANLLCKQSSLAYPFHDTPVLLQTLQVDLLLHMDYS
jgi:hypothetical protein